jgi:CheY-like chemotaxis protein
METRHKILILDDDADWLSLCREQLSALPSGPEILTANNAKRALALLETEKIRPPPFSRHAHRGVERIGG